MCMRIFQATLALVLATGALVACGAGQDQAQARRATCLYAAIDAYPTWPHRQGGPTVLDTITPCKDLPQTDRTQLRKMVNDFLNSATQG